jgi:hypothetical protein
MGAVRALRILAPLALLACLVTACGSGSSAAGDGTTPPSDGTTGGTSGASLEVRPVYARYASGVPLGPQVPQALLSAMSSQSCPMNPSELQGMLMECDAGKTVYLLKDPLVTGDVAQAQAKQVGHHNLYFLKLTLDPTAAATLNAAAKRYVGTELALCFHGSVLTSQIIDSQFTAARLVITGQYNKVQATKLAGELTTS